IDSAEQPDDTQEAFDRLLHLMREAINEARLLGAASLLTERGNAEGTAVFRLWQLVAHAAQSALAGQLSSSWDVPAIDATFQGVDRAEAGPLAEASRLSDFVSHGKATVLAMLAIDPELSAEDRHRYYDRARESFEVLYSRLHSTGRTLGNALIQEARLVWG